jgi:hypothetical protein
MKPDLPHPSCPYRGIDYYRFVDHPLFFARQAETLDLLRSVVIFKGTILFGSSGAGKSSLINAGLLSRIIEMGYAPDRIRIQNRPGAEIVIERISVTDNGQPPFLSPSLADTVDEKSESLAVLSLDLFEQHLKSYAEKERPVLIFDQFEEIVTLFEETPPPQGSLRDALDLQERIISVLVGLLHNDSLRIKILFAFREDYLAKLTKFFLLAPELPNQYMRLTLPQTKSLDDIISGPLKSDVKEHFARQQTFSQELIEQLTAEFSQRSEGDVINLSEVQIVCLGLWESDEPEELFKQRGAKGLLEDCLTKELSEFSEEQRGVAIGLLSNMLTSSNTRNFISGVEVIRLYQEEEPAVSTAEIQQTLDALTNTRLVRRELRHQDYFYEIASEFLVPWIEEKRTIRLARKQARKFAAEQKLKQAVRERRTLMLGMILLGSLLAAVIFLYIKSERSSIDAEKANEALQEEKEELRAEKEGRDNVISFFARLKSDHVPARLAAVQGLIELDKAGKLEDAFRPIIVAVIATDSDQKVSAAGSYFFAKLIENASASDLTSSILRAAEEKNTDLTNTRQSTKLPPRAYIQIASNGQRARANKIADVLRKIGFIVPALDVVGTRAPSTNQLRYYKPTNDADEEFITSNLNKALKEIKKADGSSWSTKLLQPSSTVRPGHFELWLAADPVTATETPTTTPVPRVLLKLNFKDEQGKDIYVSGLIVSLEPLPFSSRTIIAKSNSLSAPAGDYLLFVQADSFQLYRQEITLKGTQVDLTVKLEPARRAVKKSYSS